MQNTSKEMTKLAVTALEDKKADYRRMAMSYQSPLQRHRMS